MAITVNSCPECGSSDVDPMGYAFAGGEPTPICMDCGNTQVEMGERCAICIDVGGGSGGGANTCGYDIQAKGSPRGSDERAAMSRMRRLGGRADWTAAQNLEGWNGRG